MLKKKLLSLLIIALLSITFIPFSATTEQQATQQQNIEMPHYISENSRRYEAFQNRHPNIPFDVIVAYVNANVDKTFYTEIQTINNPESYTALVNKHFMLPANYQPNDLVSIGSGERLRADAAVSFIAMRDALASEGLPLYIRSGYRTHAQQTQAYNSSVALYGRDSADRQRARPGHSEHQTGLAVDVQQHSGGGTMSSFRFHETGQFEWMQNHAHEYGFILRYPRSLTQLHGYIYEPWHWRYVGVEVATYMHSEGITLLEEYYGRYLAPGIDSAPITELLDGAVPTSGMGLLFPSNFIDERNYSNLRDIALMLGGAIVHFNEE
jgi:D-alanyl-D-alanine carboxypeptidase